jgi:voltage-gated sodium channel
MPHIGSRKHKPIFMDAEAMKHKIRQDLIKKPYSVFDCYHKKGMFQAVARHSLFENVTFVVVLSNSLWIAIEADATEAQLESTLFNVVAHCFCAYFTVEMTIRYAAFKKKRNAFKDRWFCFDLLLVSFMVFETWILPFDGSGTFKAAAMLRMIRIVRLFKIARVARLLRLLPELMLIIRGITAATRSVFFVIFLLGIMIYVGAVGFRIHAQDTNWGQKYFPTVDKGMMTLLMAGSLTRGIDVMDEGGNERGDLAVFFCCFVLLANLTLLNMLIGVLCQVVTAVADSEKEATDAKHIRDEVEQLWATAIAHDDDDDGEISKEEFVKIIRDPHACRVLDGLGVDVLMLYEMLDTIFEEQYIQRGHYGGLSFSDFLTAIFRFRGNRPATVKDLVQTRCILTKALGQQKSPLKVPRNSLPSGI